MPVQKDLPYLSAINHQLSVMEESGVLNRLRDKWLHAREYTVDYVCQNVNGNSELPGYEIVEWRNVLDIFWALLAGIGCCALVAIIEKLISYSISR